ncbi:MAG: ABC-1 domain-containing protein [Candidatus Azambacteria bacterium GW2011_GWF2_46_32]|uniref:ABC-1 domain-containing protein n=2 Tax=Candidatus Azamiibacteriota TaxID=1752741 RepID=A0A0G1PZF7_9BACT|nr:MAG: ABC-1 domain-containing protein [Candidatus Azambacteria bacterium GW2011_GWF2_46_32]HBC59130.1 hypothetical protein [Candidatus Azambacteria bacterium]
MAILNLKSKIEDLNRLRQIITVFFEAGFGFIIDRLRLRYLVPLRLRLSQRFKRLKAPAKPEIKPPQVRLRESFEKLGPSFMKLGQILSLRPDLVGFEYAKELEKLQSRAATFSFEQVEKIIQKEFGRPIGELFKSFEKKAFAAASLAQVHRAVLKDGTQAAVKVQRPNVEETIKKDIHILFFLAFLLEKYIPESKPLRPTQVVKEFAAWTMRELDFKVEATNTERFRYNLKDEPDIKIPKVYWDLTSQKVLTMEFVDGVKLDEEERLAKMKLSRELLARNAVKVLLKQFLIDGFFHADPHPGNFFVLKNNIICLHDFGMVGYVSPEMRSEMVSYFMSFINQDMENSLKHLLDVAEVREGSDVEGFKQEVSSILSAWFYSPAKESIATSFFKAISASVKYNIVFPSNLVLLGKAMLATEAMAKRFYPKFDFNEQFAAFVGMVYRSAFDPRAAAKDFQDNMFDYLAFLKKLPEHTLKLLEKFEKGDIGVKINIEEFIEVKEEIDRQNDVRILAGLTAITLLTSALVMNIEEARIFGISLGRIGLLIGFVLIIWLFNLVRKNK